MAYYTIPRYEGKTEGNRIIWETAGELVYIEPYGRDAIRFRSSKSLRIDEALNWTLEEPASPEGVIIEADDEKACMTNGRRHRHLPEHPDRKGASGGILD